MANFKQGTLIGLKKDNIYYYYLILSEPRYFGCRWAYAFHKTSTNLKSKNEVLAKYGEGFHALIDFNREINQKIIHILGNGIDVSPYQVHKNSKVRIDKPGGGHEWYIFNSELRILRKQKKLKTAQIDFPVASGITCGDAIQLIDKKWKTEQVVEKEGQRQFPI